MLNKITALVGRLPVMNLSGLALAGGVLLALGVLAGLVSHWTGAAEDRGALRQQVDQLTADLEAAHLTNQRLQEQARAAYLAASAASAAAAGRGKEARDIISLLPRGCDAPVGPCVGAALDGMRSSGADANHRARRAGGAPAAPRPD